MSTIIVISGFVASGKTTVARKLSERLKAEVFSSDEVRKRLFGIHPEQRCASEFSKGIYSSEVTEKVYSLLATKAIEAALSDGVAIIDATYSKKAFRENLRKLASEKGIDVLFFLLTVDDNVAKQRIEKRQCEKTISDADWNIFLRVKERFEFPNGEEVFIVDGNQKLEDIISNIEGLIKRRGRMFKKILAAVDFSHITDAVIDSAVNITKAFGAELYLITVVEKEIPMLISEGIIVPSLDVESIEKIYEKVSEKAREKLENKAKQIKDKFGIEPQIIVDVGEPFDLILENAERIGVDLIVVGSHGKKGIERLLIGSVSEKVARKAKCSVLIVRK